MNFECFKLWTVQLFLLFDPDHDQDATTREVKGERKAKGER